MANNYPCVRGSSHWVVFVLWFTKYTLSVESTLLSGKQIYKLSRFKKSNKKSVKIIKTCSKP